MYLTSTNSHIYAIQALTSICYKALLKDVFLKKFIVKKNIILEIMFKIRKRKNYYLESFVQSRYCSSVPLNRYYDMKTLILF